MMERDRPPYGFTLVELAIVVTIVGLLLGSVLGFQRIRANAALVATIRDVSSYGSATAVFLDRYGALPGDLREAGRRIPGCPGASSSCEADPAASTTGDGNVGLPGRPTRHQTAGGQPAERETVLFWSHLLLSGLISGVTDAYVSSAAPVIAWGDTHPAAPVGGGFHVKDADGGTSDPLPGWPPGAHQPTGTLLLLQPEVGGNLVPVARNSQVLDPGTAAAIDRKIDDGDPFDGTVLGYGTVALPLTGGGCFAWTAVDRGVYDEKRSDRDCGLAFRIAP